MWQGYTQLDGHFDSTFCGYNLGVAPSQDASGKWRFIGIPYWKCGHCYWEGATSKL